MDSNSCQGRIQKIFRVRGVGPPSSCHPATLSNSRNSVLILPDWSTVSFSSSSHTTTLLVYLQNLLSCFSFCPFLSSQCLGFSASRQGRGITISTRLFTVCISTRLVLRPVGTRNKQINKHLRGRAPQGSTSSVRYTPRWARLSGDNPAIPLHTALVMSREPLVAVTEPH
jgi:hypothetical protein